MHETATSEPQRRQAQPLSAKRAFFISGFGTALEYYDFSIYGFAAALVFPAVFFPELDPMVGTLVAFAAFGTGFVARPLGGIVLGHFGDKIGRKPILVLTLVVMGLSTFLIGCLPGHSTIGIAAPLLLVALRLLQGFAAGGEWGGASLIGIEAAPEGRRGLWGSFTSMGIGLGTLLGAAVFALISALAGGQMVEFAWRIPFWIGGILVLVGLVARLRMPKEEIVSADKAPRVPLFAAIKSRPKEMFLSIGVSFGYNTVAYIVSVFFLSYVAKNGYQSTEALVFQVASSAALIVSALFCGHLSDKLGRKRVMVSGAGLLVVFFFVFFPLVQLHVLGLTLLTFIVVGFITGAAQGPIPTFLGEQFPASTRYSAISATYQIGAAIGGGTASMVATAILIATHGNPLGVSIYAAAAATILGLCALGLRETSRLTAAEINGKISSDNNATISVN
ncbi:MFS transporter [Paeniglutamicibacter sp. NPDC091659]|uniref:MFS transporter n=1 Tax=Paeniglutamicibacter sp. NPDC091659 TaxID=3364389 RepID=UPI00380AABEC